MRDQSENSTSKTNINKEQETMDCDTIWELLSVYADGETGAEETALVESHVAVCADCARDLEFMKSTSVALQDAVEVEPPSMLREAIFAATIFKPTFAERVASAVRRTLAPAPIRYGALAAAGAAALTLVVMNNEHSGMTNQVAYAPQPTPITIEAPTYNIVTPPAVAKDSETHKSRVANRILPRRNYATTYADATHRTMRTTAPRYNALMASKPNSPRTSMPAPGGEITADDENAQVATTQTDTNGRYVETPIPAVQPTVVMTANLEPVKTQIVASSTPISAGQISTIADLKRSLRARSSSWNSTSFRQSNQDKQINVDVLHGTF